MTINQIKNSQLVFFSYCASVTLNVNDHVLIHFLSIGALESALSKRCSLAWQRRSNNHNSHRVFEHSLLIYEREFSSFLSCSSIGNCYQSNVDLADDSNDRRELRNSSRERKHIEGRGKKGLVS